MNLAFSAESERKAPILNPALRPLCFSLLYESCVIRSPNLQEEAVKHRHPREWVRDRQD
jgi:hypothetical protein